mmetsp:Transcript_6761/g.17544  ORF Transcript_6761/g.17544 Transcript_6761/m.17544 type:complete len:397 (+) Transcript_6761:143-1333(+)
MCCVARTRLPVSTRPHTDHMDRDGAGRPLARRSTVPAAERSAADVQGHRHCHVDLRPLRESRTRTCPSEYERRPERTASSAWAPSCSTPLLHVAPALPAHAHPHLVTPTPPHPCTPQRAPREQAFVVTSGGRSHAGGEGALACLTAGDRLAPRSPVRRGRGARAPQLLLPKSSMSASDERTPLGRCSRPRFLACAASMRLRSSSMICCRMASTRSASICSASSDARSCSYFSRRSSSRRSISLRCSSCFMRRLCAFIWSRRSSSANLSSIACRNCSSSCFSSSRRMALSCLWYSLARAMSIRCCTARSIFSFSFWRIFSSVSWMTSSLRSASISSASLCLAAMSPEIFSSIASLAFWSFSRARRCAVSRAMTASAYARILAFSASISLRRPSLYAS